MNLGFSGPIDARQDDVENDLRGIEFDGPLHRLNEFSEVFDNGGGMIV